MARYLEKPQCQINLGDGVQPKGRGLFIGAVEQQLPTAITAGQGRPLSFLLSAPVFLSVCPPALLFSTLCLATLGSTLSTAERCKAEGRHEEQRRDIGQARGTRPVGFAAADVALTARLMVQINCHFVLR